MSGAVLLSLLSLAGYHLCVIFSSYFARRQTIIQASPSLKFWTYWQRFRPPSINLSIFDIFRSARTSCTTFGGPARSCAVKIWITYITKRRLVFFCPCLPKKSFFRAKNTHFWKWRSPRLPPPLIKEQLDKKSLKKGFKLLQNCLQAPVGVILQMWPMMNSTKYLKSQRQHF